jgi:hypothetical protein
MNQIEPSSIANKVGRVTPVRTVGEVVSPQDRCSMPSRREALWSAVALYR